MAARPANFIVQQSTDGQRIIADDFRGKPKSWPSGKQAIFRIALDELVRSSRGLAVRRRSNNQPLHSLHVPAAADELRGQPVEQFRMAGRFALGAKVFGGLDDSGPEILLPILVDHHARGERIRRIENPFCEAQPVLRQILRHWRKERGNTRRDLLTSIVVLTAAKHESIAWLGHLRHDHRCGDRFLELLAFFPELDELRIKLLVLFWCIVLQKIFCQPPLLFPFYSRLLLFLGFGLLQLSDFSFSWRLVRLKLRDFLGGSAGKPGQQNARRKMHGEIFDLGITQRTRVNPKIAELAFEHAADILVADLQRRGSTETAAQCIFRDFCFPGLSVDEDFYTRGFARAIVVDEQMMGVVHEQAVPGADLVHAPRPRGRKPHDNAKIPLMLSRECHIVESKLVAGPMLGSISLLENLATLLV